MFDSARFSFVHTCDININPFIRGQALVHDNHIN